MRHAISYCLAVCLVTVAASAGAQQEQSAPAPSKAEKVSDRAISQLTAWKRNAARNLLDNNRAEIGRTAQFKTAEGLLLAEDGKYDEALQRLASAAAADPADPASEYYRGEVLYWKKNYDDASAAWQAAYDRAAALVEANPADARAQYYLGVSLIRKKQAAKGRKALDAALAGGFDPAMVHFQIGFAHLFEKNWADAKAAFDAAAEADPRFAPLYYYRGLAWDKLDRKDNMLIDLDQFVKLAPAAPEADKAKAILAASGR